MTETTSEPEGEGLISDDIGDENTSEGDDGTEHFQATVTKLSGRIYKVIWIPILVSVLCVAALIYVNVDFRKKMGNAAIRSGRKSSSAHSKSGASRQRSRR